MHVGRRCLGPLHLEEGGEHEKRPAAFMPHPQSGIFSKRSNRIAFHYAAVLQSTLLVLLHMLHEGRSSLAVSHLLSALPGSSTLSQSLTGKRHSHYHIHWQEVVPAAKANSYSRTVPQGQRNHDKGHKQALLLLYVLGTAFREKLTGRRCT